MMFFIADSYRLNFRETGVTGISVECFRHQLRREFGDCKDFLGRDRFEAEMRFPLSLNICPSEPYDYERIVEGARVTWESIGLKGFEPLSIKHLPSLAQLQLFDSCFHLEVLVPKLTFRRLEANIGNFSCAPGPKYLYGRTMLQPMIDEQKQLRNASREHVVAFFDDGLPVLYRGMPELYFVFNREIPETFAKGFH